MSKLQLLSLGAYEPWEGTPNSITMCCQLVVHKNSLYGLEIQMGNVNIKNANLTKTPQVTALELISSY